MIGAKRRGEELDRGPRIEQINDFIDVELARHENRQFGEEYGKLAGPVQPFNQVFRAALEEVWE